MAAEPEASAISGVTMPACAWRSSPTAADGALGMYICTASGDTARMPFSLKVSYWMTISSAVPRASPIEIISRRVSRLSVPSRPAWVHSRRLSTVAIFCR